MKRFLIALVKAYQRWISPLFPPSCRFRPTCSVYMIQAIEKHGLKGVLMGIARILRCHPLSETGDDPVPDYFSLDKGLKIAKLSVVPSKGPILLNVEAAALVTTKRL